VCFECGGRCVDDKDKAMAVAFGSAVSNLAGISSVRMLLAYIYIYSQAENKIYRRINNVKRVLLKNTEKNIKTFYNYDVFDYASPAQVSNNSLYKLALSPL